MGRREVTAKWMLVVGLGVGLMGCGEAESAPRPELGATTQIVLEATAEPGSEVTYCQRVALDRQGAPADIVHLAHTFDAQSHHFFVYESEVPPDEMDPAPFVCDDERDLDKSALLYASQKQQDVLAFPDGVAFEIEDGRTLLIEWHIVNPSAAAVQARATFDITYATEAPAVRAGMLVYYHPFIYVPPQGTASAQMRCLLQEDATLMWTSSHMHARGVGHSSRVERIDGSTTELLVTDQ